MATIRGRLLLAPLSHRHIYNIVYIKMEPPTFRVHVMLYNLKSMIHTWSECGANMDNRNHSTESPEKCARRLRPYRILVKELRTLPASLLLAFEAALEDSGFPNTFQNLRVSSPAADATVYPSGLCKSKHIAGNYHNIFTLILTEYSKATKSEEILYDLKILQTIVYESSRAPGFWV